jgi:hypothetical protein
MGDGEWGKIEAGSQESEFRSQEKENIWSVVSPEF